MVQEERHGIFFCGYIDPDTLGYRVFHSNPGDSLAFSPDGESVTVKNPNILVVFTYLPMPTVTNC